MAISIIASKNANPKGETSILNRLNLLMALKTYSKEAIVYKTTANHCNPLKRSMEEKSIKGEAAE